MPRLPYVYPEPGTLPEADELRRARNKSEITVPTDMLPEAYARVFFEPVISPDAVELLKERQEGRLHALDGMFINAPALAPHYNAFLTAMWKSKLDPAIKELLMLRVGALNSAAFEWIAHEGLGRAAGLTDEQLVAIRDVGYIRGPVKRLPPSPALTPLMVAALECTDAMTVDIKVPQRVFDALQAHLDNQEMMEATVIIGAYNMISRILVATDIGDLAETDVPLVKVKKEL